MYTHQSLLHVLGMAQVSVRLGMGLDLRRTVDKTLHKCS
jgi:hypothetical protein